MILTEKQAKISVVSSGKIDKYEFLTGKDKYQNELSLHIRHQEKLLKNNKND